MYSEVLQKEKILSRSATKDFPDRHAELEILLNHAHGESETRGLLFLSAPATGASELLRQTYDRLFREQDEIIPFYFAVKNSDKTVKSCALRFLQTLLTQIVAFRREDADLLDASPSLGELVALTAKTAEDYWIESLAGIAAPDAQFYEERAFVRNCLSAPLRAAADGAKIFVIIDDLQNVENLAGESDLIEDLKEIYSRSTVQFVFAGRRRYVLKAAQSGGVKLPEAEVLHFEPLPAADAASLTENLAEKYALKINEQTRDLIVRQFNSSPVFIELLFIAAARRKTDLDSFQKLQQVYVDELFGGRIGKFYDTLFNENAGDLRIQKHLIKLLREFSVNEEDGKTRLNSWRKYFRMPDDNFYQMVKGLHVNEIINLSSGLIEPENENLVLTDYIDARYSLEIPTEQRAQVVGSFLAKSLKRAPELMSRFYRRASALDLRELLGAFHCQSVAEELLDYAKFKESCKGLPDEEILEKLKSENGKITLPETVFTAFGSAYYSSIKEVLDEERCAVGIGFEAADYREENEIAWIVAEIDSKLEAPQETTEFWCDRLEMLALACEFSKYRLWLITPEGFSPEADEVLKRRNVLGSSRAQIKLLSKFLKAEKVVAEKPGGNEYEMVVPMGEDTELIAAHAVEEIARRNNFQPKAITQIKTALVEACINATEHSLSPDRKIYQKFTVEDDKIIITISNRGIKIPSEKVASMTTQIEPGDGRRGWGLKLMRTLMDEVKFEQVDDGTSISMVKYLK